MKLLQSGASPFVRKARVTVIEAGLTDQVSDVPVIANMSKPNPIINAQNPLGKIPCLVFADGSAIFDSRVICRYLDAKGLSNLYPENGWDVLTIEAMGDGIMDSAVAIVYERRLRPPNIVFEDYISWHWEKISRTLDLLDQDKMAFLDGDITAGHISVGCALGYLDFRHDDRDWRAGRDLLATWEAKLSNRPSMAATAPTD